MSNRRRRRHAAAHLDGLHLVGSCCATVLSIGRTHGRAGITLHHDADCPVLGDDPAAAMVARMAANLALNEALNAAGTPTVSVVIA